LVGVAFAVSNAIQHEAGLVTVTVLGVSLANQKRVSVRHILEFKENLRVLIISLLFLMLSGRIRVSELEMVWREGVLFLLVLILLVRPAAVFLANWGSQRTTWRERLFLALLAPRGIVAAAVTSVFALQITKVAGEHPENDMYAGLAKQAGELVPLVFLVILGTVGFYGLLAAPLARRLGLSDANPSGILFAGADPWIRVVARGLVKEGHHCLLLDTRFEKVAAARLDGLQAVRANILSEYAEEEIDLAGLGHLVAATPNNEVNSLAVREFQHRFGKAKVWQITPADAGAHHQKAVASHMRGRFCFLGGPRFGELSSLVRRGAEMKATSITDIFTVDDFKKTHGENAVILFKEMPGGQLSPVLAEGEKLEGPITLHALVIDEAGAKVAETKDDE
jgi:hypothetical protein